MATATELSDEAPITRIAPEDIAKQRQAAEAAKPGVQDIVKDEMVLPPSQAFNDMSSKLEALLKEVNPKAAPAPPQTTAPDPADKIQTDSKRPAPKEATTAPKETTTDTITSPKAADWKAIKERKEAAEKEAADWRQKYELTTKELTEVKSKPSVDPSIAAAMQKEKEELAAERDKLQEHLNTVALERSEKFSQYFDKKFSLSIAQAKGAVGEEQAAAIEELISLPPSKARKEQINAIREELSGIDQGALDQALATYDAARADKTEQLKNSKENYKKLMEIEASKAVTNQQEAERRADIATAQVLGLAKAKMDAFKPTEDPAHNIFVAESEEFVKKFFKNKLTETEVALLPVLAREAQRYADHVVPAMQAKITELEAALAEYKGGTPRTGAAGPPATAKGERKSFTEVFMQEWPAGNR